MRLRYTRRAASDLRAVLGYIAERSEPGAQHVMARLKSIIELLVTHPGIGRATGKADIRRVVATPYPYLVFYRVAADEIIILAIRHAARDPAG